MDHARRRFRQSSLQSAGQDQHPECAEPARGGDHSTGIPHGHEGQPLVVNNTLYIITPFPNNLIALDLTKPGFPQKWIFRPEPDERSVGVACCDIVNRGASFADGKIIYNTLDAHTVAVDANSGQKIWETQVGDIRYGETTTMAPLVVKNMILGTAAGSWACAARWWAGCEDGQDLLDGFNSGPDSEALIGPDFKAFYAKDQGKDLGVKTWTPGQWKMGGGTVWGWISYDPELNLFFYGSGNPGVWNPDLRPGDNRWSSTIWARDPETGKAKWAYQVVPHDAWDYDEIMENILVDMPWKGRCASC